MSNKNKQKLVFVIICVVLGIILSIQFKTAKSTTGEGKTPRQREKELKLEYQAVLEQREKLEDELSKIDLEISEYQEVDNINNTEIKSLYDDLQKYRMFVGFESLQGSGVSIEINEPSLQVEMGQETSVVLANYDLILQLISKLNDLGAEGISINGERYTNYTSLEPQDNSIKVNDLSVRLPLKIEAIGDPDELIRGLNVKGNVMWNMQNKYLYNVKINEKENIVLPKYNKLLKLEYAEPVENEE